MKNKYSILLLASAMLMASCTSGNRPNLPSPEKAADLKTALRKEAEKSEVSYQFSGSAEYQMKVGTTTYLSAKVTGLDAKLDYKDLDGGILYATPENYSKAKIFADASFGTLKWESVRSTDEEPIADVNIFNGSVNAYFSKGTMYADLSQCDLGRSKYFAASEGEFPEKMAIQGIFERFSWSLMGIPEFQLSQSDFEAFVMPFFTFEEAGTSMRAKLSMTKESFQTTYVNVALAAYKLQELPNIPEEMRDNALLSQKAKLEKKINDCLPSLSADVTVDYNQSGVTGFTSKLQGEIISNGDDDDVPASEKTHFLLNVDLSGNSRQYARLPQIDPSNYTTVTAW
ncbi:MAG: hypothetical protein SPI58_02685 [Candidatus Enteromonas sp.]|nr:hypothetical protein [Candidatus Enteromonas sp.]